MRKTKNYETMKNHKCYKLLVLYINKLHSLRRDLFVKIVYKI